METRAHHIIIGLFVLLTVLAAAAFALWINRYGAEGSYLRYDVVFAEPVTGLSRGADVAYNGIRVGEVRDLRIDQNNPQNAIVSIRVRAELPVKTDTVARLQSQGLTGVSFIQLAGGSQEAQRLHVAQAREVPVIRAETSALQRLFAGGEDAMTSATGVMQRLSRLLSEENTAHVDRILANFADGSAVLSNSRPMIEETVQDARVAMADLRQAAARLERLSQRFEAMAPNAERLLNEQIPAVSEDIASAAQSASDLMKRLERMAAEQEVPLKQFSQSTLADIDQAVAELRLLLKTFNRIGERVEQDPAAYLLNRQTLPAYQPEGQQ
jgi:phospholipid/cholesterol/gamma-HCH transport system substrate-binding protein